MSLRKTWNASRESRAGEVGGRRMKTVAVNAGKRKNGKNEARRDEVGGPGSCKEICCLLSRVKSRSSQRVRMAKVAVHTSCSGIPNGDLFHIPRWIPNEQEVRRHDVSVFVHQTHANARTCASTSARTMTGLHRSRGERVAGLFGTNLQMTKPRVN